MSLAMNPVRSRAGLSRWVWQVGLLAALYVPSALLGLQLAHYHENATLVWPAAGLALAGLILFGRHLWPGIFLAVLLLNSLASGMEPLASLGIAVGNTLQAVVGATLLMRAEFRPTLERPRDVAAFLLIGVIGSTVVSCTIGVGTLLAEGLVASADFLQVWAIWWLGDAGGVMVATPVLLMVLFGNPPWMSLIRRFEFWLALAFVLGASSVAFLRPPAGVLEFALALPCFPGLVWAGARFGSRGAMLASLVIISTAIAGTAVGRGPFSMGSSTEEVVLLWSWSMVIGSIAFTLATLVEQRDVVRRRYRAEEAERLRSETERLLLVERERMTREMHDGLGGQLVSLLSMVEGGRGSQGEVAEGLRRALDDISIVIDSMDPSTTELPVSLGKLRARVAPLLRRNGIDLVWQVDDVPGLAELPPEAVLHLLRIIQEAVTNALRHAQATRVEVTIRSCDESQGWLRVSICDDGCGVLPGSSLGGRGVRNMHRRAKELGAVLRIEAANPGTRVDLRIPLPG